MKGHLLVAGLVVVLLGADAPKENPAKEEATNLEGTWTVVSQSEERFLPERYKVEKIAIKGNRLTLRLKTNVDNVFDFTVDPTKDPKHLDRTFVEGLYKGTELPGIYELDRDQLKYCYNAGSRGPKRTVRPTEFKGDSSKDDTVLLVLKRDKP